jgi:hypothetical protein
MREWSRQAMVEVMSEPQYNDPSGNTEAFQAFVKREGDPGAAATAPRSSRGLVIGIVIAVVIVAVVVWLVVGN